MNYIINRNFTLLWSGRIVSQMGDKFYAIALSLWVLEYMKFPGAMGIYLTSAMLPGIVLGLFTGPIADRFDKKKILILSDCIRGLIVFGILTLSLAGILAFEHIIIASVLLSLSSSFFETSAQSIVPEIVEKEKLQKANSLNQLVGGICSILGPAMGAAAVVFFGYECIFVINAISFLISALFEVFLRYEPEKKEKRSISMLSDMIEGFRYLGNRKKTMIIIIIIGIAHFFMGSLNVAIPFLAGTLDGNTKQNVGWLEAAIGIGLTLGAIYIGIGRRNRTKDGKLFLYLIAAGLCFTGMGILSLVGVKPVVPYLIMLVFMGIAIVNASVYWQSLLQSSTPSSLTGRVFSLSSLIGNISLPVAFGVYGVILQGINLADVILISGLCLVGICGLLMRLYTRIAQDNGYRSEVQFLNITITPHPK